MSPRKPGFARTGAGRPVFDTGKVIVGLRAGEQPTQRTRRGMSRDEEQLQNALVRYGSAEGNAMHPRQWRTFGELIDSDISANRSRFDDAVDSELIPATMRAAPLRRPQVFYLRNGIFARLVRWVLRIAGGKS